MPRIELIPLPTPSGCSTCYPTAVGYPLRTDPLLLYKSFSYINSIIFFVCFGCLYPCVLTTMLKQHWEQRDGNKFPTLQIDKLCIDCSVRHFGKICTFPISRLTIYDYIQWITVIQISKIDILFVDYILIQNATMIF